MEEVKFADLKKAVKEINSMGIEGVGTIRTVGIKRLKMEDLFLAAVDSAVGAGIEDSLSDDIIDINNGILDYREGGEEKAPAKNKEKAPAKNKEKAPAKNKEKAPAKNKEKAPAKKKPRSCYDHIVGCQTGNLDEALREGGTMREIMESCSVKRTRVLAHIRYLKDTCGLTLEFKENKKDNADLDYYKFKEEIYRKP